MDLLKKLLEINPFVFDSLFVAKNKERTKVLFNKKYEKILKMFMGEGEAQNILSKFVYARNIDDLKALLDFLLTINLDEIEFSADIAKLLLEAPGFASRLLRVGIFNNAPRTFAKAILTGEYKNEATIFEVDIKSPVVYEHTFIRVNEIEDVKSNLESLVEAYKSIKDKENKNKFLDTVIEKYHFWNPGSSYVNNNNKFN